MINDVIRWINFHINLREVYKSKEKISRNGPRVNESIPIQSRAENVRTTLETFIQNIHDALFVNKNNYRTSRSELRFHRSVDPLPSYRKRIALLRGDESDLRPLSPRSPQPAPPPSSQMQGIPRPDLSLSPKMSKVAQIPASPRNPISPRGSPNMSAIRKFGLSSKIDSIPSDSDFGKKM